MHASNCRPRALLLYGGWEGHEPEKHAQFALRHLLDDFEVTFAKSLDVLNKRALAEFDLLLPIWTFGEIDPDQERALLGAVQDGLGVLAWHGATSAFLHSRPHKHLLGGQFVAHPGGDETSFRVRFDGHHPLTAGLEDVDVTSEQYYLLLDPANEPVAFTTIVGEGAPWLSGTKMPVAWTRNWGSGRVFYCSLGHFVEELELPSVKALLQRAARWACRADRSAMASEPLRSS